MHVPDATRAPEPYIVIMDWKVRFVISLTPARALSERRFNLGFGGLAHSSKTLLQLTTSTHPAPFIPFLTIGIKNHTYVYKAGKKGNKLTH